MVVALTHISVNLKWSCVRLSGDKTKDSIHGDFRVEGRIVNSVKNLQFGTEVDRRCRGGQGGGISRMNASMISFRFCRRLFCTSRRLPIASSSFWSCALSAIGAATQSGASLADRLRLARCCSRRESAALSIAPHNLVASSAFVVSMPWRLKRNCINLAQSTMMTGCSDQPSSVWTARPLILALSCSNSKAMISVNVTPLTSYTRGVSLVDCRFDDRLNDQAEGERRTGLRALCGYGEILVCGNEVDSRSGVLDSLPVPALPVASVSIPAIVCILRCRGQKKRLYNGIECDIRQVERLCGRTIESAEPTILEFGNGTKSNLILVNGSTPADAFNDPTAMCTELLYCDEEYGDFDTRKGVASLVVCAGEYVDATSNDAFFSIKWRQT
ncbi:hypothetical protein GQ600_1976 [Phytophthora cactorum]|nr:hypothetical protein GQ600_1976 [Phytophthora cactorum]